MKAKITEADLINWWLDKYHGTNLDQVVIDNPEWDEKKYSKEGWGELRGLFSRQFYDKYQVTQEQHDEWNEWAIKAIAKNTGMSLKYVKQSWGFTYLNVSPKIKEAH